MYMKPPPIYDHPLSEVCKLQKYLYGLKQALVCQIQSDFYLI